MTRQPTFPLLVYLDVDLGCVQLRYTALVNCTSWCPNVIYRAYNETHLSRDRLNDRLRIIIDGQNVVGVRQFVARSSLYRTLERSVEREREREIHRVLRSCDIRIISRHTVTRYSTSFLLLFFLSQFKDHSNVPRFLVQH